MSNAEEMKLDTEWVETLQKRLLVETEWDYPGTMKPKTFRVSKRLRDNNPNAYDPAYISLGPYHRDKGHLQAMYILKWHCL
ncbi:hypothetical protein Cni_G15132 [Canna indica]|uniref:Uncharacterized protein n=1 Tax=Canna indica TaxID=4628 RepID=A0AAQ3KG95_9LILI|nr:hypothetical protein Cni_G15132 [Canna indica]